MHIIFFLALMAIAAQISVAAETSELPWIPSPKVGCWVRYRLALPHGNSLYGRDLRCTVKVHGVDGRKLSMEYVVEGLPQSENVTDSTIIVNDDNFDPARVFGLNLENSPPPPSTPVKFKVAGLGIEVDAQKLVTSSAVDKSQVELEVIRSRGIPFGLARISGNGLILEVESFSWGDDKQ